MGEFLISRVEAGRRVSVACANPDSHTSYLKLRRKLEWMLDLELDLGVAVRVLLGRCLAHLAVAIVAQHLSLDITAAVYTIPH